MALSSDENVLLAELREAVEQWRSAATGVWTRDEIAAHLDDITRRFERLDNWISTDGWLPDAWSGSQ